MGKVSKKALKRVLLRTQTTQFSHNYERMQSLSFTYDIAPALDEIYEGRPKEEKIEAIRRHLEYFNTHPIAIPLIAGISIAMEEKTAEDEKDSVRGIKTGLMGPFAGLGDSMLNLTWFPIAGSIGASLCISNGSIVGPIVMFLMINLLYWPLKYYGLQLGYKKGMELLDNDAGMGIFDRVSNFANVLGVIVVSALIPNTVKVATKLEIPSGEGVIALQNSLDSVMPAMLSVIVVYICYSLLKQSKGKNSATIILGVLVFSIVLSMLGVLG